MTDTERETCERIATAMGWECDGECWRPTKGTCWDNGPPDFFTDPVAADALMRWLRKKWRVEILSYHKPDAWTVILESLTDSWKVSIGIRPTWMEALASAAGKAIEEAERVKTDNV